MNKITKSRIEYDNAIDKTYAINKISKECETVFGDFIRDYTSIDINKIPIDTRIIIAEKMQEIMDEINNAYGST